MFTNIARCACLSTRIFPFDAEENFKAMTAAADSVLPHRPDILVFGEMALSGASLGALLRNRQLCADCLDCLFKLAKLYARTETVFLVGLPLNIGRSIISASAVVYGGKVHGFVASCADNPFMDRLVACTKIIIAEAEYPVELMGRYRANGISFTVAPGYAVSTAPPFVDTDLLIIPNSVKADPVRDGLLGSRYANLSSLYGCGVAVCSCGLGESSYNGVYKNLAGIFENGFPLGYTYDFEEQSLLRDIDLDLLPPHGQSCSGLSELGGKNQDRGKLNKVIPQNPFLPEHSRERILNDIADTQIQALITRMQPAHLKRPVVGLSGGIDSALALLVCAAACDKMRMNRQEIIALSMPCFGTSSRSKVSAERLAQEVGTRLHTISIEDAVMSHFDTINHDPTEKDTVYENAQARERAQVLFDVAGKVEGLVIGTGDLSETALGWCTFNGDHMSGYNVNASLTKTMVVETARTLAARMGADISIIIEAIASAPPSPELLPGGSQVTQNIIGPYALHDFFLYYYVKHGIGGDKLLSMAKQSFEGRFEDSVIEDTLATFMRRFLANQFKRNCSGEGALFGDMTLTPYEYSFPSDLPNVKF